MYNESQIQNDRDWGNFAVASDYKGRTIYRCKRCHKVIYNQDNLTTHVCDTGTLVDGIDFVVCNICGWHNKRLVGHLRTEHGLKPDEYSGPILCENSKKKYESVGKENGNWIERAKDNGEDLSEYLDKMGNAVRESILSNPEDRKRRASVMGDVNRSDVMRQKASETAKKTSSRPEILEQRSANLKKWRDENPDEFYDKCIHKMMNTHHSKPELILYDILKQRNDYKFKLNQVVKSNKFISKSKRKQVDIGDKSKRFYVEFDGELHFEETKLNQLERVHKKDVLLDDHINEHGWILIRVGYDQFSYRKSDYGFKKECIDRVFDILDNPAPGVYKIGDVYG
jgi:hypothetical protein